jgi:hypothetical protein
MYIEPNKDETGFFKISLTVTSEVGETDNATFMFGVIDA